MALILLLNVVVALCVLVAFFKVHVMYMVLYCITFNVGV